MTIVYEVQNVISDVGKSVDLDFLDLNVKKAVA